MKTPKCKHCSGEHYSTFCFQAPKKPIKVNKPLPSYTKPLVKKRKPLNKKSKSTRAISIEKLDRVFSTYIRLSNSINGIVRCVTCGATGHYKSMQNGHFISRRKMSVRWDEMNCHVQCVYCNENLGGNLRSYALFMKNKYGEQAVEQLLIKSRTTAKVSESKINQLTDLYTTKVEIIKKGLTQ